jgi:hypothetical protein
MRQTMPDFIAQAVNCRQFAGPLDRLLVGRSGLRRMRCGGRWKITEQVVFRHPPVLITLPHQTLDPKMHPLVGGSRRSFSQRSRDNRRADCSPLPLAKVARIRRQIKIAQQHAQQEHLTQIRQRFTLEATAAR